MHASLSRPTRVGSFHGQRLDARAGQASMTIVQGTTPDIVYMQKYLLGDPDMLKVHVHLHETEFTARDIHDICLSHSSTNVRKDPVNYVSRYRCMR